MQRVWLLATAIVACQPADRGRCVEYDKAEAVFNELTATVLDPSFQDPRFVKAAEMFEAVPAGCERKENATSIARSIRDGQTARASAPPSRRRSVAPKAPPPAAPPPSAPPTPVARVAPDRQAPPTEEQCQEVVDKMRKDCPKECRARRPGTPAGLCDDMCEQILQSTLSRAKCPPVPRLPKKFKGTSGGNTGGASAVVDAPAPPPPRRRPPAAASGWRYCAYFLPSGNHKVSFCSKATLAQAQARCDARLKKKKIEGTCSCTDDQVFIGDRCK